MKNNITIADSKLAGTLLGRGREGSIRKRTGLLPTSSDLGSIILIAVIAVLGLVAQGCGSSKGGRAGSLAEANLVIDNDDTYHSATVYVDGDKLGTVASESYGYFQVVPGVRKVEVRFSNDLNPRIDYGTHDFTDGKVVRLTVDS